MRRLCELNKTMRRKIVFTWHIRVKSLDLFATQNDYPIKILLLILPFKGIMHFMISNDIINENIVISIINERGKFDQFEELR
jgi:hypothetical protein